MPSIADLYRTLVDHEEMKKTAAVKKTAIESTHAPGQTGVAAAMEDVLGNNVAETKIRIKKKLEDVAGAQKVQEALGDHAEEMPGQAQAPIQGDKMPPGGDKGVSASSKVSEKLTADAEKNAKAGKDGKKPLPAFMKHKKAGEELTEEEKVAEEHYAAGRIIARGFVDELSNLMGSEQQ